MLLLSILRKSYGFSFLVTWHYELPWFWMTNRIFILGIKLSCSWYIVFFMFWWLQFSNILLYRFASIFMGDTGLEFIFFKCVFHQGTTSLLKWVGKYSLFCILWKNFYAILIISFLNVWWNSSVKAIWG